MDSTTSQHHDSSSDHDDERGDLFGLAEAVGVLAGSIGDERALGSALFLSRPRYPARAFLGNPPRSAQKKRDQARSGPERGEKS